MDFLDVLVWVVFIIATLFNVLKKRQRKAREQAASAKAQAPTVPAPAETIAPRTIPAPERWGRQAEAAPFEVPPQSGSQPAPQAAAQAEMTRPAPAPARPPRHRPLGSPEAVRHAIVAMTVLGPCRAIDPFGQAEHPADPPRC